MPEPTKPLPSDLTATSLDPSRTQGLTPCPLDQVTEDFHHQATLPVEGPRKSASPALPSAVPGYEILRVLGRGGMGVVYQARQLKLNRFVALKMILAGEHAGGDALERFRAEAESEARLQHPNIVHVYEIGDHEGRPYFSLEFVEGGSLAQKLAGAPLPPPEAARLVETLARAMDYAHQRHIIHRDLKPANVLLTQDGTPKIADFGLAKQLEGDSTNTQTGAVVGTPSYMAPEQAAGRSKDVGPLADVYSLGAILYECLTGRPPFKSATPLETVRQVAMDEPVPPTRLQPKTPRDLETICLKCLEKQPAKRYASALKLAEDLRRYQAHEPIEARPVGVVEQGVKWAKRRPAVASLLGTIVGLTAAAILLLTLAWQSASAAQGKEQEARKKSEDHLLLVEQEKQQKEGALKQVEDEKQKTEDALKKEEQLRRETEAARKAEAEQRRQFQRLSVDLLLDRGISTADRDDPGRGLLWMTRSLQLVAKEDADLERAIRRNLAGWSAPMHPLRCVVTQATALRHVVSTADSKTLLTCGRGAQRWDAATGELLGELPHKGNVYQAVYGNKDKLIATAGEDKTVCLWDAVSGAAVGEPLKHSAAVRWVTFSPDGKLLAAVCSDFTVWLWDVESGKPIGEPLKHDYNVWLIAFNPNGSNTLLTAGSSKVVRLWDAKGQPIGTPLEHEGPVQSVAFSADGKLLATGSSDTKARVWNAATGELVGQPLAHPSSVYAVAFRPGSAQLLTGCGDRMARLWNVSTGQLARPPLAHPGSVEVVEFSRDGKLFLTASEDQTVRVWVTATVQQLGAPLPHQNAVKQASFSPDSKTVVTRCNSGIVRVWTAEMAAPELLTVKSVDQRSLALSLDGQRLATGTDDGNARVFKIAAGQKAPTLLYEPISHKTPVQIVTFSHDGQLLLTACRDQMIRFYDAATGEPRGDAFSHGTSVHALALSDDNKTILVGGTRVANLYDAATKKRQGKPLPHPTNVWCVAFSPKGDVAATGCEDGVVRFWNVEKCEPLPVKLSHRGDVKALAFSADGKYLLTGSDDRTARLWHVDTGKPATLPLVHGRGVSAVAIRPDGELLLTTSQDGRTQLWEVATGKPIGPPVSMQILGRGGEPVAVGFSPDGQTFVAARRTNVIRDVKVPLALAGDAERLTLWAQVLTGLELDDEGTIGVLDGPKWRAAKERLEKLGGSSMP